MEAYRAAHWIDRFMPLDRTVIPKQLAAFNRNQISQAGARYTPGVDPNAPNIANGTLISDLDYLTCGTEVEAAFSAASKAIEQKWTDARKALKDASPADSAVRNLSRLLGNASSRIRDEDPGVLHELIAGLRGILEVVGSEEKRLEELERAFSDQQRRSEGREEHIVPTVSPNMDSIRAHLRALREFSYEIRGLENRLQGSHGNLLVNRFCLLVGQWGTGKTHFLCDYARRRTDNGRSVLFLLAKSFQSGRRITSTLASATGIAADAAELMNCLEQLGKERNERILVIIDGVNEGARAGWRSAVDDLVELVAARKHLALVVSCRSPFEDFVISNAARSRMTAVVHRGFDEQEFDAQAEFFRYYNVPLPEVPLLEDEFSRPLTLKLICESFRGLGTKKLKEGFHGLASGQKGMTFVLEAFVKRVAGPIERRHGLPAKTCWELLKGKHGIADPKVAGFAGHMAATLREYVTRRAAHKIISAQLPLLTSRERTQLLDDMRVSGLLDEDYIWSLKEGKSKRTLVLRLPYQRFSDHLIARHLLDRYLDKTTEETLRASFANRQPLGRVFGKRRHQSDYVRPGWAEALIVEFPEAVKRVALGNRELFFFLPRRAQNVNCYYQPFIQGLFWRAPTSFCRDTDRIVATLLERGSESARCQMLDALVAISIKPRHPYSARRLYKYLSHDSLSHRDRTWSEYLRKNYRSASIVRLLSWVARMDHRKLSAAVAEQLIVILSLVLTTVVRRDRDIATRALVEIGERYPRALFGHALRALEFNDPYVPERMLAAACGVAMSKFARLPGTSFRSALCDFARKLYAEMFAAGAPHSTFHALRRDYAASVIRIAALCQPQLFSAEERDRLDAVDGSSPFRAADAIEGGVTAEVEHTIQMDFGNYTLGRLIPGRSNYDNNHAEYKRVRRQVEWRIWDLGYRKADFENIDRDIGRTSWRSERDGERIDRYGKKYGWIAYFEMYGLREAQGMLRRDWERERTSDCDIDPSFPKRPPMWNPPIPPLRRDSTSANDWVATGPTPNFEPLLKLSSINGKAGPWVLLQGFVQQEDTQLNREVFTFLRGLFVRKQDVVELRDKFTNIEYPGNHEIPDSPEDYYLYAGEAGKSPRFASDLRMHKGRYRRFVGEAFSATERIPTPSAPKPSPVTVIRILRTLATNHDLEESASPDEDLEIEIPVMSVDEWRRIPGIKVELPARRFAWESYHSQMNDFSGFLMPAASIIGALELHTWNREVDFRDPAGRLATLYREAGSGWSGNHHSLLYIREDCLRQYLRKTRQVLVWCNWGERRWANKDSYGALTSSQETILQSHKHIHRRFHKYRNLP